MKRAVLVTGLLALMSVSFVSCGYSSGYYKPPGGFKRVVISQGVTSTFTFGGLFVLDGERDVYARTGEIPAGINPGLMTLSPTKATLLAFDSSQNTVQIINAQTGSNSGSVTIPGPTNSMVIAGTTTLGYAAVPTAPINGYPAGAVEQMDLTRFTTLPIGVPNAKTVLSNDTGTQLLVFSSDSNNISVLSPFLAVGPIDQGCNNPTPTGVCVIATGFDRPVTAIWNGGSTAYVLNCGAECGGTQASIQIMDLSTNPPTAGASIPVDGATVAFASGTTLYVAGNSPTAHDCAGQTTAATTCGRLDVVDLSSMSVTASIVIPDGYHDRIDMSVNGQLFVGSHDCTNIGNVNNPVDEVRGCLAIVDTTAGGNYAVVVPPDNGDVTGLQSFTSRNVEYVAEGGELRIYDTVKKVLQPTQIVVVGKVVDVKQLDLF